jgi:hypothetical protein
LPAQEVFAQITRFHREQAAAAAEGEEPGAHANSLGGASNIAIPGRSSVAESFLVRVPRVTAAAAEASAEVGNSYAMELYASCVRHGLHLREHVPQSRHQCIRDLCV